MMMMMTIIIIIITIIPEQYSGKHEIKEVQNTVILGTAHVLRKVPI